MPLGRVLKCFMWWLYASRACSVWQEWSASGGREEEEEGRGVLSGECCWLMKPYCVPAQLRLHKHGVKTWSENAIQGWNYYMSNTFEVFPVMENSVDSFDLSHCSGEYQVLCEVLQWGYWGYQISGQRSPGNLRVGSCECAGRKIYCSAGLWLLRGACDMDQTTAFKWIT